MKRNPVELFPRNPIPALRRFFFDFRTRNEICRTGGLAACLVGAMVLLAAPLARAQSGQWIWWSGGSDRLDFSGAYETKGTAASANGPGGRENPATWTDTSGNLWLFGGSAASSGHGSSLPFNDMWRFSPESGEWTRMGGTNTGEKGVYGTRGAAAASNVPGPRVASTAWTDASGNLWLLGGGGYDSEGTLGELNDLWEYHKASGEWEWVSGNQTLPNRGDSCWPGVYGERGVAAAGNLPGGRMSAVSWTDASGAFWLSGGVGCDANGSRVLLNDLWRFDPGTHEWTWIGGSSADAQNGVYGKLGAAAAGNVPGGRWAATAWSDSQGNLWLFGGEGLDGTGARGYLNDLWKFDIASGEWTWMSGSSSLTDTKCGAAGRECWRPGVYGTLGRAAQANAPGGRSGAVGSVDAEGNLWLFGGANDLGPVLNFLNDLWEFNPKTREWARMGGSNGFRCGVKDGAGACPIRSEIQGEIRGEIQGEIHGEPGVYGALGVAAPSNAPGSRNGAVSWTGLDGHFWVFGGSGLDASGNLVVLDDLWEYAGPELKQTPTVGLAATPNPAFARNPVTLSATVTARTGHPSGTVTFLDGGNALGTADVDGAGKAILIVDTLLPGSHRITARYGGDAANAAAESLSLTQVAEDYAIHLASPTTATVKEGGTAVFDFTVSPVAPATHFPASFGFTASGGPRGTSYVFSPAKVADGGATTAVKLTVTLPGAKTKAKADLGMLNGLAMALLLLPLAIRWRKALARGRGLAVAFLGLAALAGLAGCGPGGTKIVPVPFAYTVVIEGNAGGLHHAANVTLNVE